MKFSPLTLNDIEPWADLLALSFNRKTNDMRKLLIYLKPRQQLLAWGAWDGSRLAAQYSCLLRDLCLPRQPNPASVGMSINMAVHPDYRGRGLVKNVSRPVYEALQARGCLAGVGFSNAAGVKVDKRSKGYGYRVVGKMKPMLVCVLRPPSVEPLTITDKWPDISPINQTDKRSIRLCATPSTIFERFAAHPFRQYRYGTFAADEKGQGVVVYKDFELSGRLKSLNRRCVSLLMAYGDDLDVLLGRWLRALWQEGIYFVHLLFHLLSF